MTGLLLLVSGFFVAAEFALVGARRHRLEQAAEAGRRGARQALNGVREISLMLAGAQLGITMVVVGLGMVSEPAFHHLLERPLGALGLPEAAADSIALIVALIVITFLHVVIGEMAPKSWAISHPERSAMMLAPAFRGFTWLVRWVLIGLNRTTNGLLRLMRVTPRDEVVHVRNREQIHHLVDESSRLGLIDDENHGLLTRALGAPDLPVSEVMVPAEAIVGVPASAGPGDVVECAKATNRTRPVVWDEDGDVIGAVHVREALLERSGVSVLGGRRNERGRGWTAGAAATAVPRVSAAADLHSAADVLRAGHAQLGLVVDDGKIIGLVSMDDLVSKILMAA